jgi:hypothetical protein
VFGPPSSELAPSIELPRQFSGFKIRCTIHPPATFPAVFLLGKRLLRVDAPSFLKRAVFRFDLSTPCSHLTSFPD